MNNSIPQDSPLKQCTRCNEAFPSTTEFFYAAKSRKSGLASACKTCHNAAYVVLKPKDDIPDGMRKCMACEQCKPATSEYFHASKKGTLGLNSRCRDCRKIERQEIRQADPEKARAYEKRTRGDSNKRYKKKYPEKARAHAKAGYWRSRLAILQRQADIRKANPERFKLYGRNYKLRDPERARRSKRQKEHKRRARKLGNGGTYSIRDTKRQFQAQKGKCYYCGIRLKEGKNEYHIDHIVPLSRGGSNDKDNLVVTCPTCNCSKSDKLPHEWGRGGRLL